MSNVISLEQNKQNATSTRIYQLHGDKTTDKSLHLLHITHMNSFLLWTAPVTILPTETSNFDISSSGTSFKLKLWCVT
jgi:hypothetical protein